VETSERQPQDQVRDVICVAKDSSDGLEGVAFGGPMINFHDFNVESILIPMRTTHHDFEGNLTVAVNMMCHRGLRSLV